MKPCHVCDLDPAGFHCVWDCGTLLCAGCADDHDGVCDLRQGDGAPYTENEDGIYQDAVL